MMAMSPEGQDAPRTLAKDLGTLLEGAVVRTDRFDERYRLMRPFEKRVAEVDRIPNLSFDDRAARIITLLWHKTHPARADIQFIVTLLADDDATVRATAAATLASLHDVQADAWDRVQKYPLRLLIEQHRAREQNPALAFQLDQLIERMASDAAESGAAAPVRVINPYVAGPPLRERRNFFGRRELLNTLKQSLVVGSGARSIVIQGARRTGKTSLLYWIRDGELGADIVPVYFDMQSVAGMPIGSFVTRLAALLEAVRPAAAGGAGGTDDGGPLAAIGERLSPAGSDGPPRPAAECRPPGPLTAADFSPLRRAMCSLLQRAGDRAVVMLFDEYEVLQDFIQDGSLARQLQSILEEQPRLFFVFAGAQKIGTLKGKDFQILLDGAQHMKVSFLTPADTRSLIVDSSEGALSFPDDVVARIQSLTAGHPFYTQALCQSLFNIVQAEDRAVVSMADVERSVSQFVENPAPHLVLGWNALGLNEKVALAALAPLQHTSPGWTTPAAITAYLRREKYPIRLASADVQEALSTLREQDWTTKRGGQREFQVTMDLVRRWLVEHRSIWELLDEQRHRIVEHTAGLGRRGTALGIDVFTVMLLCLAGSLFDWPAPLIVGGYFMVAMLALRRTPGMLLMKVRPLTEAGAPLRVLMALQLAVSVSVPWLLIVAAYQLSSALLSLLLVLVAVGLVVTNVVMVRFGAKRRGLFDKLTHTVFVVQ